MNRQIHIPIRMPRPSAAEGAPGTETVDLSLRLLEHLARSPEPKGLSELAREFDASKATVYRHLQTLVRHDFVRQDEATMRYAAGIKLFILGERLRERFDVLPLARGEMARLRDATGHAVTVSALVDGQVVVLDVMQGTSIVNFGTQPGTVLELHASAHGKTALAFGPPQLMQRCLAKPLKALTSHTLVKPVALERNLAQARGRGWTSAPNQALEGINGLAAPIFNHVGSYAGAIAIVGTVQLIAANPSAAQVKAVKAAAAQISKNLGFNRN